MKTDKSKPIEIKDELEQSQKPTAKDISEAEKLAEDVSPLLKSLFNANEKSKTKHQK